MRILVIWAESLTKPGAGTTHAVGLVKGLLRAGCQVTTISPLYKGGQLCCEGLDVAPLRLPRRGWLGFLLMQLLSVLLLPWWIRKYRPQAIYVRTCFFQGLMALLARPFRVPLIGEIDSIVDDEILQRGQPQWMAWLVRGLDRVNFRLSSGLVCVTRGLRNEALRRGGPPDATVAIHNGAMTDVFRPGDRLAARMEFQLPADAVIVGFIGSFAQWQGLDLLIDSAAQVRQTGHTGIHFALLGGGDMEPQVRQWIQQRDLADMVTLRPFASRETTARFLAACDASVLPIHDERRRLRHGSSALKFWDALGSGLPVLVPTGADLDDVLADLQLPGAFDPHDASSLAKAVIELAGRVEEYRQRRGEIHRRVAEKYSWDCIARQVLALMERLAAGKRTRP